MTWEDKQHEKEKIRKQGEYIYIVACRFSIVPASVGLDGQKLFDDFRADF